MVRRWGWFAMLALAVVLGLGTHPMAAAAAPSSSGAGSLPAVQAVDLALPSDLASSYRTFPSDPFGIETADQFGTDPAGAVACAGNGWCAAFGDYSENDANASVGAVGYSETNGHWSGPTPLPLPAGVNPNYFPALGGIACPADGQCVAVGELVCNTNADCGDTALDFSGVVETLQGGQWTASAIPRQTGGDFWTPVSVACASISSCTMVGFGTPDPNASRGADIDPYLATGSVSDLAAAPASPVTLPGGAASGQLEAVACADNGTCGAYGRSYDGSGNAHPFVLGATGGSWSAPVPVPLPPGASSPQLASIACNSVACHAVGLAEEGASTAHSLTVDSLGPDTWTATDPGGSRLDTVSCPLYGSCVASGSAYDTPAVAFDDGAWSPLKLSDSTPVTGESDGGFRCSTAGPCYEGSTQLLEESAGAVQPVANVVAPAGCSDSAAAAAGSPSTYCDGGFGDIVACADSSCTALGDYPDASGAEHYGITDVTGEATLSVADAAVLEPGSGTATLQFPVTVSGASGQSITVHYATSDGSATAGADYVASSGTLTIPAGATTASIPVTVNASGVSSDRTLTLTLSGASGTTIITQAKATGTITARGPLRIDVQWLQNGKPIILSQNGQPDQPNTIRLADTDSGEVPQNLTARVTVTNTSEYTQQNVSFNGTPPLSYHNPADARQALPVGVTGGPADPSTGAASPTLPDLGPGQSTTRDFTVNVTNNGVFDFSPQLLSTDVASNKTRTSNGVGTFTALPTALLWLSVKRQTSNGAEAGLVRPGTPVYLAGTVTNRSLTQTLDVQPLLVSSRTGNIGPAGLADATSAQAALADGVVMPFAGKLQPGQTVDLIATLHTGPVRSTRATVAFTPAGALVNSDGTETDLTSTQVGMSAGSSPIDISFNQTDPVIPPPSLDDLFDNFTDGAAQGAGEWAVNGVAGAINILQHPIDGGGKFLGSAYKVIVNTPQDVASAGYILAEADLYADVWLILTPKQRQAFEQQIIDDFNTSIVKADNEEMAKAISGGMDDFVDAAYRGDYNALAKLSGNGLSTGAGAVADQLLTDVFFQNLALGLNRGVNTGKSYVRGALANDLVLAERIKEAKLAKTVWKSVEGIEAGQNLLANSANALRNAWGLLPDQITKLKAFCEENGLIIAIRSRSARAAELIQRGLAVGKNEVLKIKGVNEIDTRYLGYRPSDINTLVLAEPLPRETVLQRIRGLKETEQALVLERYEVRVDEWGSEKVRGVMDKANQAGKIDWGFNGTDNGVPKADRKAERLFKLKEVKGEKLPDGAKRTYQTVYVGNAEGLAGRLVRVTQDVDVAAILNAAGEIISPLERRKIYMYLSNVLGIEHPETASWIKLGELGVNETQVLFKAKLKELSRIAPGGGEALAVFNPKGGVTAGFFNPALTVYNSATNGGRIIFEGGYNNPYAKATAVLRIKLKPFF